MRGKLAAQNANRKKTNMPIADVFVGSTLLYVLLIILIIVGIIFLAKRI